MDKKSAAALLKEKLMEERNNGWTRITDEEQTAVMAFAKGYMDFIEKAKTEREAIELAVTLLEEKGFVPFASNVQYKAGDRVYQVNRNKALIAAVIGKESIEKGVHIAAAHVDSPRLDLKQHPLYEAEEMAYLKTHYYGGIRKYQWPTVPLALHGVVVRSDGQTVKVNAPLEKLLIFERV
jgi:aspartyl aminopeptidase